MRVILDNGTAIDLGLTEDAPTIGITDFSRRVTDDFGITTVVERGFSRRMSVKLALPFGQADMVQQQLADLRATPALWVADDRFASLSVRGFYKDFSLDLNVPPLSYCTLTVEGLAETTVVADPGGDPAPEGMVSTLRLIQPVAVTDVVLTASSVAETDHAEWAAGATYAIGARVMKAATHRVYESAADGNVGNDPAGPSGKWLDIGATNRWAMFDQALGSETMADGAIVLTLDAGASDALALLDVGASVIRVQADGYDRTQAVGGGAATFFDLPGGPVVVTIAGDGPITVGTLLIGQLVALGVTEASPTAGINDYSRKEVDDFGTVTVVQRSWAKRMAVNAMIRSDAVDVVANRIAAVRARPALWIGEDTLDSLTVYGFFKDFSIAIGERVSKLSLTVEGLSKAAKILPFGGGTPGKDGEDGADGPYLDSQFVRSSTVPVGPPTEWYDGPTQAAIRDRYFADRRDDYFTGDAFMRCEPGDVYELDGYINATSANHPCRIGLNFRLADGTLNWISVAAFPAGGAGFYNGTIIVPAGAQRMRPWAVIDGSSDFGAFSYHFTLLNPPPLWLSTIRRNGDGTPAGGWSAPVRISGEDGKDGSSGLTAYLTNETFTQPTNAAGAPEAIANGIGDGQMRVFLGTQDVTAQCTFTAQLPFNLYVTVDGAGNYTATNLSGDTGYAFIVASYNGQVISKRLSASRSRGGADGSSPPLVTVSTTHYTFRLDTTGAAMPQTTRVSALPQNSDGAVQWRLLKSDGTPLTAWTDAPGLAASGAATRHLDYLTFEIDADRFAAIVTEHATPAIIYEARLANAPGVTDRVSITRIADGAKGAKGADGAAGLAVYLTNPSHTVPATPAGAVTSYAGSDFTVVVMAGGENVTGSFAIESTDNPQGLSVPGSYPNFHVNAGLDAYEATATLKLNLLGSGRFDGVRLSTVYSLAKSIAGANGESPPLLTVQASALAIITNPDGSLVANTPMTFSATRQNTDAAVVWAVFDGAGGHHRNYDGLSFTTDAADLLAIINYPASIGQPNTRFATVRATCAGITDFVTVWAVRNGSNGANGVSPYALSLDTLAVIVNATFNGITKEGQLPRNIGVAVRQATVNVIDSVTIGVSTSANIAASYANGVLTVTAANGDGFVEVTASVNGTVVDTKRVLISRKLDPAPPQTATGQTTLYYTGDPVATTFQPAPTQGIVTLMTPANGQMPILMFGNCGATQTPGSNAPRSYVMSTKIMYRLAGGTSAWSDLGPGGVSSTATWDLNGGEIGELEASYTASLAGNTTYEFGLMLRKSGGNGNPQYVEAGARIGY